MGVGRQLRPTLRPQVSLTLRCEVMLASAPVRRTWQSSPRACAQWSRVKGPVLKGQACRHWFDQPSLTEAMWRHLHCDFISCWRRLAQDENMQTSLESAADRSRPRRHCRAKLSLSSREGLPNLAFNHFASTLPLFAASLARSPRTEHGNHRSPWSQI